jgi:fumarate reductase subunit C
VTEHIGGHGGPEDFIDSERYFARYRPRMSVLWWVRKRSYLLFILRELSSVAIAWFVVFLLLAVRAVGQDESAYERFLDLAGQPWVVTINVLALAFVLLHVVTWFDLTPKAMVARIGGRRVPGWAILASQYVGLAVVSGFVYWLLVRA